jgi:lipopolysaccharide transport system permease protein
MSPVIKSIFAWLFLRKRNPEIGMEVTNSTFKASDLPQQSGPTVTWIEPAQGWLSFKLGELWAYRELLYFLVWRDVKVHYKQTAIGAAWAVLQPLLTMIVFTFVFSTMAKVSSGGIPYPVFTYSALLPWNLFAGALNRSTASVVGQANLIHKVYFPRLIVPIAATISGLVDFAIAFVFLVGMMVWYRIVPSWDVLTLPILVLLALATGLAVGLWLSAMNVKYRDVGHAIPFVVQLWMFASPIFYPISIVPERWKLLYSLNPIVGVVEGFRWALLGEHSPNVPAILVSTFAVIVLLFGGLVYFRRMERTFADVV